MVEIKHARSLHEKKKQGAPKCARLPHTVELEGSQCRIRSRLTPEDIPKIPSLSFHGMRAGGLDFFESGNGRFQGYAVYMEFHKLGAIDIGQFLDNFLGSSGFSANGANHNGIKICLDVAIRRSSEAFVRNGYRSLDSNDYPAVMLSRTEPVIEHLTIKKDQVLSVTMPSDSEIQSMLRRTNKIPQGQFSWELARLQLFRFLAIQKLAQRVVNELERIVAKPDSSGVKD